MGSRIDGGRSILLPFPAGGRSLPAVNAALGKGMGKGSARQQQD